jgi:hypothetical protein
MKITVTFWKKNSLNWHNMPLAAAHQAVVGLATPATVANPSRPKGLDIDLLGYRNATPSPFPTPRCHILYIPHPPHLTHTPPPPLRPPPQSPTQPHPTATSFSVDVVFCLVLRSVFTPAFRSGRAWLIMPVLQWWFRWSPKKAQITSLWALNLFKLRDSREICRASGTQV